MDGQSTANSLLPARNGAERAATKSAADSLRINLEQGSQADALNVCLASYRFHPAYAGPAVRFQRYAPGLRARGIQLHAFSAAWTAESLQGQSDAIAPGDLLPTTRVDGIPVERVWVGEASQRQMLHYTRAVADFCIRERPAVVQFLQHWAWSPWWLLKLRAAGVPMVYTATMLRQEGLSWPKVLHSSIPLRLMDCIVVSSSVMRESLRDDGIRTRIEVIPNGLDLDRFRPANEEERRQLRSRLGLPLEGEIIAFIGGFISERKGVDVLAEAWTKISERPSAHLVLVGPTLNDARPTDQQRAFLDKVEQSLSRSAGHDRVVTTGAVDNVQDYLRAADLFVFPSRREGMPNTVLEAFGCGVASVLTPFIGLPEEFGRPGIEYALIEREPQALAAAVIALLEDPAERRRLGESGRSWVENYMGVELSLDLYAALYEDLAKRGARSRARRRSTA